MPDGAVLRAHGLYHIYRGAQVETVALRGAELVLEDGSWTSLMGPSGSGKSTLVHVLAGLLEPSGGAGVVGRGDPTPPSAPPRARWGPRPAGLLDLLADLHRRQGMAILAVTHNPQVSGRADRRLTMRDGRVTDDA